MNIIALLSGLTGTWTKHNANTGVQCWSVSLAIIHIHNQVKSLDSKHHVLCSISSRLWVYSQSVLCLSLVMYWEAGAENVRAYACHSSTQLDSKIKCLTYDYCIALAKYGERQTKKCCFFFSTENGGGHGWISSKADLVWYTYVVKAILEQLCSLLFFLILLKAMIFLLSYYILSFYHIWNILHIFPFLSGFVSDWEQFSKFLSPSLEKLRNCPDMVLGNLL